MNNIYKVAVIGMGKRGKHHAAAFNANPKFQVTAICDIDKDKVEASAPSLGNPATFMIRLNWSLLHDLMCSVSARCRHYGWT